MFTKIKNNACRLVQRHVIAVYREANEHAEQIGTGFLVRHSNRPVLVTAKHVLYGVTGDEPSGEKAIFVQGSLRMIAHLHSTEIARATHHDIAALYVDEFGPERCLPPSALSQLLRVPRLVTMYGYLARDFKRHTAAQILQPSPWIYTNTSADVGHGRIGLRYPKSRNRNTDSGCRVMTPLPKGMSGCPMLDGEKLAVGQVDVVGVFTDKPPNRGIGFGERSLNIARLLNVM